MKKVSRRSTFSVRSTTKLFFIQCHLQSAILSWYLHFSSISRLQIRRCESTSLKSCNFRPDAKTKHRSTEIIWKKHVETISLAFDEKNLSRPTASGVSAQLCPPPKCLYHNHHRVSRTASVGALSQPDSREPAICHGPAPGVQLRLDRGRAGQTRVWPRRTNGCVRPLGVASSPTSQGRKSRIAREGWCGGKRSTCPYQRTWRGAAKEEAGGCPARARTVSLETRSRHWMPRIDLRALLSKPSSLEKKVPVSGQVSAPYSSTDRTAAALYMRILVVREMDCWRHNGLRFINGQFINGK